MKLKYLFCIFFFVILRGISFSQDSFDRNLDIVNKLIDDGFTSLSNKMVVLGKDKFYLVIFDPGTAKSSYLLDLFRNKFYDYKLIINEDSDSIDYKIIFANPNITTTYKKIFTDQVLGIKKVEREIAVSFDVKLAGIENDSILLDQKYNEKANDNIDLDKVSSAEDKRFDFSSSNLPEENTLNQVLFPAIIIGISAAAIILFFTIRSK